MLKNYFKVALRNLINNKGYSFINIFGLAVGMAVALLIGLWVRHELSYDGFNTNKKQIGIIEKRTFFNNQKNVQVGIMLPLYDELKTKYPQVKHITRLDWGDSHSLKIGDKKISKNGNFADPDILKIFSFPLLKGSIDMVLKDPLSIVLTESTAVALFGQENPLGKTVNIDNQYDVNVTGILKDIPKNSSVQFDFLMPYELAVNTNDFIKNAKTQWRNNFLRNIVELKEGVSMASFSKSIEHIVQEKVGNKDESTLFIHPMEKWHLYDEFKDWKNTGGRIEYVRLFAIIGFLVLSIACINFMNLSTARSEKRAKEVGIRKAIGSQRKNLIAQFLGESMLTAFLAFIISLLIVQISLPFLADIGFRNIELDFSNFPLLLTAFAGCIVTGLLAGSYPALYLSGFNTIKVLKGSFKPGRAANLPRKILVVTQFSFSIALIIGTIIVFQQIQHAKKRPLGYNPDKLLAVNLSSDLKKNFTPLKKDLLSSGYVEAVTRSSSPMTNIYNQWDNFSWEGKDPNSRPLLAVIMVDYDYDITSGIKITEGRFFSKDFATDSSAVIINETTLKLIGYKNPLGKSIKLGDETLQIVGVSQDVLMQDPFKPVMPAVMLFKPDFIAQGLIRLKQNADIKSALVAIEPFFEKYNPSFPFDSRFVDEDFDRKFRAEKEVAKLSGIFSVLTVFISCLGLFGLAAFMSERRNKEIGVRKVMGASVSQIWMLLSKDFLLLVAISCALASPIAYWFLQNWLEKYEYRVDISPLVFVATAILAIAITIATISYHAIRSAKMNPVKSLRTE